MITTKIFYLGGDYIVCDLDDKAHLKLFSSEDLALKYCKEKEKLRKKQQSKEEKARKKEITQQQIS